MNAHEDCRNGCELFQNVVYYLKTTREEKI